MSPRRSRRFWFRLILVVLTLLNCEIFAYGGLYALYRFRSIEYQPLREASLASRPLKAVQELMQSAGGGTSYLMYSRALGWTIRPCGVADRRRANAQGLRADREYSRDPADGILRLAAFGDSFTHGSEVGQAETWEERLNELDHGLEVLNFGVGGYGFDQALLRYEQDGGEFKSQLVLIGFMPENIYRIVNTFRPFYVTESGLPFSKPRFVLKGETLKLLQNPLKSVDEYQGLLAEPEPILRRLGEEDYYFHTSYRAGPADVLASVCLAKLVFHELSQSEDDAIVWRGIYNAKSEALPLLTHLVDRFDTDVLARGATPIFLILPERYDIERYARARTKRYEPLLRHLKKRGYRFLDFVDAFSEHAERQALSTLIDGHYTPRGNELVAQTLLNWLREEGFVSDQADDKDPNASK